MIRYRTLGNNDVACSTAVHADVPGIIAHYVMISSIACTEPGSGEDTSGYGPFLRRDIELLGRALVHSRMGKAPQYRIVQAISTVSRSREPNAATGVSAAAPFASRLAQGRMDRDRRIDAALERDATLRHAHRALALAGATLDVWNGERPMNARPPRRYRSSVLAWLVPLCVASAGRKRS